MATARTCNKGGLDTLVESLFESFNSKQDLSLKSFLKSWVDVKFSSIYDKTSGRDLHSWLVKLFETNVQSFDKCNCLERRIFSLFLVACVFLSQPDDHKVPIRITIKLLQDLQELIATCEMSDINDVANVARGLVNKDAYLVVHSFTSWGPAGQKTRQVVTNRLDQDRFNSVKQVLEDHCEKYSQLHKQYEELKESHKDILNLLESTPDEVSKNLIKLKDLNPNKSNESSTDTTETEDIGQRRRRLKKQAV